MLIVAISAYRFLYVFRFITCIESCLSSLVHVCLLFVFTVTQLSRCLYASHPGKYNAAG